MSNKLTELRSQRDEARRQAAEELSRVQALAKHEGEQDLLLRLQDRVFLLAVERFVRADLAYLSAGA